jgi:hypothetical protein
MTMRQSEEESQEGASREFSPRTVEFIQRLYRDPRYLLVGKTERFGRELISFVEGCTVISATGEIRGQTLLNGEYEFRGRPDGERPYGQTSLADHFLSPAGEARLPLSEEDLALLREESWQYYVRRNFAFLLEEYSQARDDAEHNLSIWNLVEQSDVSEEAKWTYLRWWPWIERDRAIAQALWCLRHGEAHAAATELYRAQRSIEQYGERRASFYARERDEGDSLCEQMNQHVASLAEILREDDGLPTSYEEQLDRATARADQQEVERLRREMIQRAVSKDD